MSLEQKIESLDKTLQAHTLALNENTACLNKILASLYGQGKQAETADAQSMLITTSPEDRVDPATSKSDSDKAAAAEKDKAYKEAADKAKAEKAAAEKAKADKEAADKAASDAKAKADKEAAGKAAAEKAAADKAAADKAAADAKAKADKEAADKAAADKPLSAKELKKKEDEEHKARMELKERQKEMGSLDVPYPEVVMESFKAFLAKSPQAQEGDTEEEAKTKKKIRKLYIDEIREIMTNVGTPRADDGQLRVNNIPAERRREAMLMLKESSEKFEVMAANGYDDGIPF